MRLVLASASPRRRELLAAAGIAFDVDPVHVDESQLAGEPPERYVERVARMKAEAAARRHPDRPVLGADTTVTVDGVVLAKPDDARDAERMLRLLSGRTHDVLTAVAIGWQSRVEAAVERTAVTFAPLSDEELSWYIASGEPEGKAGAYAIQGLASRFIPRIEGSYTNVVGLPVAAVLQLLRRLGVPAGGPALPAGR
jgi:septum formation protein